MQQQKLQKEKNQRQDVNVVHLQEKLLREEEQQEKLLAEEQQEKLREEEQQENLLAEEEQQEDDANLFLFFLFNI